MAADHLLGRAAYGIAVGAVALVVGTAGLLAIPAVRERLAGRPASYVLEQQIDVPASLFDGSTATAVLFARGSCPACQRSKPVLTDLVAQLSARGIPVRLATNGEDQAGDEAYATSLGLSQHQVVPLNTSALRLRVVPTIVLVDRHGLIRYAHEGAPTSDDAASLMAAARTLTKEPRPAR